MKKVSIVSLIFLFTTSIVSLSNNLPKGNKITISRETLLDKIKGAWAGQVIGVCYGQPTEFHYQERIIPDSIKLELTDNLIKDYFNNDDLFMDLTFVEVFERLGLDTPVDSFAIAFATKEYGLAHANQHARHSILHGIMPPASGHWLNNPHADDIDYQIESDFAGIMSPGMPNTASEISDKIGHMMNYGDGWYGGVFVGAMYALAFVSNDIAFIVSEALNTLPEKSKYHQCISDVIRWYEHYPDDWKQTWVECQQKYAHEDICPDGALTSFNIDAVINGAYIVIGLLYGKGDFEKTVDIATRCGQDSDCNPSSAAGILGAIKGYDQIPDTWLKSLKLIENTNFAFTNISLNKAYQLSYNHALQVIRQNGGKVKSKNVVIAYQQPKAVRYEKGFEGHYPNAIISIDKSIKEMKEFTFEGVGIVFNATLHGANNEYEALVEMSINGNPDKIAYLPASTFKGKNDLIWKYGLPKGKHKVTFKWLNPKENVSINVNQAVVYNDTPLSVINQ